MNKKIEISRQKTNKMLENAELQNVINIDALNSRETTHEELEGETGAEAGSKEIFEIYPGENTCFWLVDTNLYSSLIGYYSRWNNSR